jgi:hypothetical protein
MHTPHNALGEHLRQLCTERGISIPQIAHAAGIDRSYLYRLGWETTDWLNRPLGCQHVRQPSRDLVIRVGVALGLDLDALDELLLVAGYAPLAYTGSNNRH